MPRYLIVANQTLGGELLDRTVQDCIERGDSEFYIVVPATALEHEAKVWGGGFAVHEGGTHPRVEKVARRAAADARRRDAEAHRRAQGRLDKMIERIQSAGGEAAGSVGDADPVAAVQEVLNDKSFDEVIVSTLPAGISRWVRMDLPSRIARMTEAPVTTLEAED